MNNYRLVSCRNLLQSENRLELIFHNFLYERKMDNYSIFDTFDDEQEQFLNESEQEQSAADASETAAVAEQYVTGSETGNTDLSWDITSTEAYAEEPDMNWDGILAAEQGSATENFAVAENVESPADKAFQTVSETVESFNDNFETAAATEFVTEVNPVADQLLEEIITEISAELTPQFTNNSELTAQVVTEPAAEAEMTEETTFVSAAPANEPAASLPLEITPVAVSENEIVADTPHTHNTEAMKFDLPEQSSIIKVIGVGGGGSNAVNHMYRQGIRGVDFVVCNTDKQALDMSPVPNKIVLGAALTEGRGAGSMPEVGRNAAIENIEDIRNLLANNTKMCFITAGMGGGTGTGAAPIIAGIARELGILTVAIVTVPFAFEGKKRRQQAEDGLEQLKQNVDTLLVVCNDKLREMYGNLKLSDAFSHADDVLSTAAKSIAEIISLTQQINVDFADVCTVMRNSGVAIMGSANASGENRATRAVEMALSSPLLNDNNITGARYVLLNIISGATEITMDELGEITDYIQEAAGQTAEIIKGYGVDETLGESVNVTIIATGFNSSNPVAYEYSKKPEASKVVLNLATEAPVQQPAANTGIEPKADTANPLEPFLVKKEEPKAEEIQQRYVAEPAQPQQTITFEITNAEAVVETPASDLFAETPVQNTAAEPVAEKMPEPELKVVPQPQPEMKKVEAEEQMRKAQERIQKLKELSLKLKTSQGLNELENEPAYKRRNIQLDNVAHSSESQVSRFTLTETEDKKIEIRPNNSFLHDNVD
jgi:cell division protein FtsZ